MIAAVHKYYEIGKMSIMNTIAYAAETLSATVFVGLIIFTFINLWQAVYAGKTLIEGYTLPMMIWYLVMTETIVTSNVRVIRFIGDEVRSGNIAYALSKPYHYIAYQLSWTLGKALVRMLLIFGFGALLAYLLVGPIAFSIATLPAILAVVLLGSALNYITSASIGLLAFWFEDSTAFYFINQKLVFTIGGMLVPLEIFPEWLANISYKLPYAYLAYYPARTFVRFNWSEFWHVFGMQVVWFCVFLALTLFIYNRGVKKLSINGG